MLAAVTSLTAQLSAGLSGGASIPLGSYQEYTSRALGNASIGGQFGLDLYYQIHKNVAIGVNVAHFLNPVDAEQTAEDIWNEYKTAATVHVSATPYQLTTAMLSVRPQTGSLFGRFSLFAGLSAGMLVAQSPTYTQELALSSPLHQTIESAVSTAFALQGEAGLQLRVSDNLGLGLFANYLTSKPTFEFERSDMTGSPTESVEQHIQSVNVGLRLQYTFDRSKVEK